MNYIERCFYSYRENINKLNQLILISFSVISVHGHNYNGGGSKGITDPVYNTYIYKEDITRKVKRIMRKIRPVERLERELQHSKDIRHGQMLKVLRGHYFNKISWNILADIEGLNIWTIYKRRRELLKMARVCFYAK